MLGVWVNRRDRVNKYQVHYSIKKYVVVEAKNLDEALDKAENKAYEALKYDSEYEVEDVERLDDY